MKWLAAVMASIGLAIGVVLAVATHHAHAAGWTGYAAVNQVRYADYLPKRGASWLPAIIVYPIVGVVAGLVIATVLARFGFRLTRDTSSRDSHT